MKEGHPPPFIRCELKTYHDWINHGPIYKRTCRKAKGNVTVWPMFKSLLKKNPLLHNLHPQIAFWPFAYTVATSVPTVVGGDLKPLPPLRPSEDPIHLKQDT